MGKSIAMPQARVQSDAPKGWQWSISPQALDRWQPHLVASASDEQPTISIFERIGADWTGEGVTVKRIAGALRSIGADKDVTVLINSVGGNLFEGMAIYNLLREHKGTVTVKVLGIAASAASVIAMAGDEIQIARAGFLMIHNAWIEVQGNRNDLRDAADFIEPFDMAMADIYAARTGIDAQAVMKKMDAETWINGTAAIDEGWADALLPADQVVENKATLAVRAAGFLIQMALGKAGMSRGEARSLLQDYKSSMPRATGTGTPRAAEDGKLRATAAALETLKTFDMPNIFEGAS